MVPFAGFPARGEFTPVPNLFFGPVLEGSRDLNELKCALRCLYLLHRKKGWPKFLTLGELAADVSLLRALAAADGVPAQEALAQSLDRCVASGVLLSLNLELEGTTERLFFTNTPQGRQAMDQIRLRELTLPQLPHARPVEEVTPKRSIFHFYEQHVGVVTPLLADALKEAEALYPASWIEEAFSEAALNNKRSWRYVEAILRRWKEEGREDGEAGRRSQKARARDYLRSYGRFIKS
ncbi:MAG: DnaD domain protein [Chloroflexi bacterium]|nr:DnaD domain protein [Chloroflexota bacterium]